MCHKGSKTFDSCFISFFFLLHQSKEWIFFLAWWIAFFSNLCCNLSPGIIFLSSVDVFDRVTLLLFPSIPPASPLIPPITTVLSRIPKKRRLQFRSIPIANFLSRGRGYCLFFTSFFNLLVRLLRISRSPYVWCWPFRSSFPFRKHSKPYHCWKEGLLLFGCCKGIAFRLSASLCNSNSPRGLIFFSSSISRSGEGTISFASNQSYHQ